MVMTLGVVIATSSFYTGELGGYFIAFVCFVIGGFFATAHTGIELSTSGNSVKHYTRVLGYKKGSFRSYDDYPFVYVSEKSKGSGLDQYKVYETYLLSKSQKGRVLVGVHSEANSAEEWKAKVAALFNVEPVKKRLPGSQKNGHKHPTKIM
jgi:hypothetical protein